MTRLAAIALSLLAALLIETACDSKEPTHGTSGSARQEQRQPDIQQIADLMVRLCVGGGRTQVVTGGGTAGADFSLRSMEANGKLAGEFKVTRSSAEGLVQGIDNALTHVAADQADKVRECLQPVRERVLNALLPGEVPACRDPSHGVERYLVDLDVTRESPEMGGGHDQPEWCNTLTNTLKAEHPNGEFSFVRSGERRRNHCPPFNCPQYTYSCTIHVKEPIHVLKKSPACQR